MTLVFMDVEKEKGIGGGGEVTLITGYFQDRIKHSRSALLPSPEDLVKFEIFLSI